MTTIRKENLFSSLPFSPHYCDRADADASARCEGGRDVESGESRRLPPSPPPMRDKHAPRMPMKHLLITEVKG